jgi:hypothetical protein
MRLADAGAATMGMIGERRAHRTVDPGRIKGDRIR